jgi:hypothetical protein
MMMNGKPKDGEYCSYFLSDSYSEYVNSLTEESDVSTW